jgi:hypothetical protein
MFRWKDEVSLESSAIAGKVQLSLESSTIAGELRVVWIIVAQRT